MGENRVSGGTDTEARILDACQQLCREHGPRGLTTRAVAAAAGVNEVTLFRHFPSKDHLLRAMVTHTVSRMGEAIRVEPSGGATDLAADLAHWASAYLDHMLPVADMVLIGLVEARWDSDLRTLYGEFALQVPRPLAAHLEGCAQRGEIPAGHFGPLARAFYEVLLMKMFVAHVRTEPLEPRAVAAEVGALFAAALHAVVRPPAPFGQHVRNQETEE